MAPPHLSQRTRLVAAADVPGIHGLNRAREHELHGVADAGSLALEVNGDASVVESREGTRSHARGDQGAHAMRRKQVHRPQASALFVRRILDDANLGDLTADDLDEREAVAVAEVAGAFTIETALAQGRDR